MLAVTGGGTLANGITLGTAGGIVNTSADVTLSGVVDGAGSLVKQGVGLLNLTGHQLPVEPMGPVLCRSEEHTSELQSLMRLSYAVFCLTKKQTQHPTITHVIQLHMKK